MLTRNEYLAIGADLSVRDATYLEDETDAEIWAHHVVSSIVNIAALVRGGVVDPRVGLAAMLELSNQE